MTGQHVAHLLSGEVTCTCGWSSGHYALALDAMQEFDRHVEGDKPVTLVPAWTVGALLGDMAARQSKALPTPTAPPHTVVVVPSLPGCDVCKYDHHGRERDAAYDAKSKRGPWAYMCEECFADQGIGLGLGLGQRLEVRS